MYSVCERCKFYHEKVEFKVSEEKTTRNLPRFVNISTKTKKDMAIKMCLILV